MASPVIVEWIVKGIPEVARAARSVQDSVAAAERGASRAAEREARSRDRIAQTEARAKVSAWKKADAEIQRIQERAARDAVRGAQAETKAFERAAQDKVRAKVRADDEVRRIQERSQRDAQRAHERAESQKARATVQAGRQQVAQEMASRRQFASTVMGAGAAGVSRVAGGLGRATGYLANTLTQLGGGFSVADSVHQQASFERQMATLSNNAFLPGQNKRISTKELMASANAIAIKTGMDREQVGEGLNAYTAKTGKFADAAANAEFYAKVSKATGSSMKDVMGTAGGLAVQNKHLTPAQLRDLTLSTVMQARQGSVEFSDMAKAGTKITRSAVSYQGDQGDNQRRLLGLSQVGMKTAGSAEEAATNLANVSADAMKHSKTMEKVLGKGMFNEKGQIVANPGEFIANVMEKSGGNLQKIQGMGFGARSMKMFQAVAGTFNEAEAANGGPGSKTGIAAGKEAVLKEIEDVTSSKYSQQDLDKDFANIMQTSAEQFEQAVRQIKMDVGEKLLPEFLKLIPILQQIVPPMQQMLDGVIKIANWAAGNPFTGLSAAITLAITSEIAKAAIGNTIKSMLVGGGGAGGGGAAGLGGLPGGAGGAAGAGGSAGLLAGGGVLAASAFQAHMLGKAADLETGGGEAERNVLAMIKSGDVEGAQKAVRAAQGKTGTGEAIAAHSEAIGNVINSYNPIGYAARAGSEKLLGGKTGEDRAKEYFDAKTIVDSEAIRKAIAAAVAAGAKDGASTAPSAPNRSVPLSERKN